MKDDLISRKAVIKAVDKHKRDDGTLDDDISIILEEIKTAFDKEEVINQLESSMAKVQGMSYNEYTSGIESGYCAAIMDAIEIVEEGGIE